MLLGFVTSYAVRILKWVINDPLVGKYISINKKRLGGRRVVRKWLEIFLQFLKR